MHRLKMPPRRPRRKLLPKRKLGRTGVEVSILNFGTFQPDSLNRLLPFAWANGVRYVDTAHSYGSEPAIAKWMKTSPEIRKELFLVTKDTPGTPRDMIKKLDERLEALETDYIDLIFIHAVGDRNTAAAGKMAGEPGIQRNRRSHPQIGQGKIRRFLVSSPAPSRDPPKCRKGWIRGRDHAAKQSVEREGGSHGPRA